MTPLSGAADPSQSEVVAFLGKPESYGSDVAAVETIDTHASVVFLAGDRAYKLKRAVRYSYLDYSTLALRQRACEREVALNRRTAPELYLEAAPVVRRADGALALVNDGGDESGGEAVEWLVVMRRFAQADLFDRLAAAGVLTVDMAISLADRIAGFHQSAAPATEGDHGGGSAGLGWVIEENEAALRGRADLFAPSSIDRLSAGADAALARIGPLLDRRLADGFVRDCHGDLHLSNVCLIDGEPVIFDGIEFNDRIARIDVFYDLAFLLMDLTHRGLTDHANATLTRYLQQTGDFAGLATLPLFLSQRAAVRAHVRASAAAIAVREIDRSTRQEAARRYFDTALSFLAPGAAALVAVGGFSGSGKTSLARALAPNVGPTPGAVHLRSDVIRKQLFAHAEDERLPDRAYDAKVSETVYDRMLASADECLNAGHAVICDAVYGHTGHRDALSRLAGRYDVPFVGFWLDAPVDELVRRVAARTGDASDATPDVVRRQVKSGGADAGWCRIDAAQALGEVLEAALRHLDAVLPTRRSSR